MRTTRKQHNLVHWITQVSVVGIAAITMVLVVIIAAFNGIEGMVEKLYSEYDADITIRSTQGKTFLESTINIKDIQKTAGVINVNRAVEETVILKHRDKWINARMVGVDVEFLKDCNIGSHIVEGYSSFEEDGEPRAIIGATLLDKIDGYISELEGGEDIVLYTPLRDAKVGSLKSPFKVTPIKVTGKMNYNREVNAGEILVPLDFAREQLDFTEDLTALYVSVKPTTDPEELKESLQAKVGKGFVVKTAAEKNELIFKTSKSEKRIVVIILVFVFILAAFNLIASLTMLYIEKSSNIQTLYRIGVTPRFVFKVFFIEGLLIAAKGIVFGLTLGAIICACQVNFALIQMPNSGGAAFPISFTYADGLLIVGLVSALSIVISFLPVWYLVRKSAR